MCNALTRVKLQMVSAGYGSSRCAEHHEGEINCPFVYGRFKKKVMQEADALGNFERVEPETFDK